VILDPGSGATLEEEWTLDVRETLTVFSAQSFAQKSKIMADVQQAALKALHDFCPYNHLRSQQCIGDVLSQNRPGNAVC
jgi:hypothetical protein